MKLSKTSWIVLVTGIILIAAACLGWTQVQQNEQRQQLDKSLSLAQARLANINFDELNTQKDQLTLELQRYNSNLEVVQSKLEFLKDSIDTTYLLLEIAGMHNVTILNLTSPGLGSEELEVTNCETLEVTISASGALSDLVDYVTSLSREFPTSMAKTIGIKSNAIPEEPSETPSPSPTVLPTPVPITQAEGYTATINLTIYNYKGEQDVK